MTQKTQNYTNPSAKELLALLEKQILVIDGAMGTMIQRFPLTEDDFRGEVLKNHAHPLKGNNELLCLTRPDVIEAIHVKFLEAGANILETNTFSSNQVSQGDYKTEFLVADLNKAAVTCARNAIEKFQKRIRLSLVFSGCDRTYDSDRDSFSGRKQSRVSCGDVRRFSRDVL